MTLSEFKAWFEGFTEGMDAAPDEKQWERIKARVKDIDGVAITKTVFVDRYVSPGPWRPYWSSLDCVGGHMQNLADLKACSSSYSTGKSAGETFNSHSALMDLGKAEYSAALGVPDPRSIS